VASRTAELNAAERIEQICLSTPDSTRLRIHVLDEIRKVVDHDAHVWLVTDPLTAVGSAPLADVPCLPELPEAIRLKYLTEVNRWTRLHADGATVGLLRQATAGDPGQSPMWRGILRRYGIGDVASAVFADRFGIWGFLDLWREDSKPAYRDCDAAFLASISPSVTRALRSCQAQTLTAPAVPTGRELGPVVFLLDDSLRVLSQTPASQEWLEILLPAAPGQPPVPASVYNVAGQLLALEQGVDSHPSTARVHLANGFWVTLRAARLNRPGPDQEAAIAVTMEETSPVDRLEIFTRAFGLSARETELMGLLARGSDTRDLARRMFVTQNTVQDHLKSIFAKTGSHNRRTLLSRALGVSGQAGSIG
jgi:DNA-binding CsgD family transcriptional regulator